MTTLPIRKALKKNRSLRQGFTLVEIAISIGVIAVITTVAVPEAMKYHYRTDLDTAVTQTVQAIGVAQSYAVNGKNASSWGISTAVGIVFQGEDFASRDTTQDVSFPVPPSVIVTGLLETYFSAPYGVPHPAGIIVLTSKSGMQRSIRINESGLVEVLPIEVDSGQTTSSTSSAAGNGVLSSVASSSSTNDTASSTQSQLSSADTSSSESGAESSGAMSSGGASDSSMSSSAQSQNSSSALDSSNGSQGSTTSSQASQTSATNSSASSSNSQITGTEWNIQNVSVLLLSDDEAGALSISGNGNLQITNVNGSVVLNSASPEALKLTGNGSIATATTFDIVGDPGFSVSGNGQINGVIRSNATPMSDPLASVPVLTPPSQAYAAVNYSGDNTVTLDPGAYVGGISVSGNAHVILNPGIYYLQGGGLSISGNASITGQNVLVYNAPATDNDIIRITGNGNLTLSPMTTGTFAGISLFQSRASALGVEISWDDDLVWNGSINIDGVVYLPTANLKISGNGNVNLQCLSASRFILNGLTLSGNAQFRVQ